MGAEIPICPLCHTVPTTTNPPVPQNLKTLLLKQQTQVRDRIPVKGCRHLLVKPWANGTGTGNTCQLCGAITNDEGEIKQVGPEETGDRRGAASFQQDGGGTYRAGSGAGREAKRLLEDAHVEVQAAQNKVTEAAFRVGQAKEEMARIKKLLEANSEPAGQ